MAISATFKRIQKMLKRKPEPKPFTPTEIAELDKLLTGFDGVLSVAKQVRNQTNGRSCGQ